MPNLSSLVFLSNVSYRIFLIIYSFSGVRINSKSFASSFFFTDKFRSLFEFKCLVSIGAPLHTFSANIVFNCMPALQVASELLSDFRNLCLRGILAEVPVKNVTDSPGSLGSAATFSSGERITDFLLTDASSSEVSPEFAAYDKGSDMFGLPLLLFCLFVLSRFSEMR